MDKHSDIKIGDVSLGDVPAFIVAEIGSNHGGNMEHAMELIRASKESGADGVKFQSFLADEMVSSGDASYPMLKRLELSKEAHQKLYSYASSIGIPFFSTCSNEISLEWLKEMDVSAIKIASTNLNCLSLVRQAAETGKTLLISTGMSRETEIEAAIQEIEGVGNNNIVIMHCVSDYPAKAEDANVRYIETLNERFGYMTGYSDHTTDSFSSILAVSKGAVVLEKHFTVDRRDDLPDSSFSLDPAQFRSFVSDIRRAETVLGDGKKMLTEGEDSSRTRFRRSVHARVDLPKGHEIRKEDIKIIRPNDGIDASEEELVLGKKTSKSITADSPVKWSDLEG